MAIWVEEKHKLAVVAVVGPIGGFNILPQGHKGREKQTRRIRT
jgi:hypothetical protein